MRRLLRLVALLLGVGLAYLFLSRAERPAESEGNARGAMAPASTGAARLAPSTPGAAGSASEAISSGGGAPYVEADFPIVASLNTPGSTIERDLDIVSQVFDAWQSNFPRDGNPVGENAEITAALMGENRLGFALVPKGHRAVNEQGELVDRWGTPFRFHQLSGTQMEIRSAGPDRRFATEDDAVWTPE